MLMIASRASYSPERSVRTSSCSTTLWTRSSSASDSAREPSSPSSRAISTMSSRSSRRVCSELTRSSSPCSAESRPVTRWALAWSSQRSGAATCSPRSAISARMPSRSRTFSIVAMVAWSCLISESKSRAATRGYVTRPPTWVRPPDGVRMSSPIDHELVTEAAARFARVLTERPDTSDVLYRLAEDVNEVLGLAGTGVSLADSDDRLHPVTGINQLTTHLEEAEERIQEGPCINAFRDGAVVTARTTAELSETWPHWSQAAEREGVQAVAGVPLRTRDLPLGSVNLYRRSDESWDASELGVAELFAD